ncbi:uncharacterized protein V6R79_006282 [Siganus canaliculatus]
MRPSDPRKSLSAATLKHRLAFSKTISAQYFHAEAVKLQSQRLPRFPCCYLSVTHSSARIVFFAPVNFSVLITCGYIHVEMSAVVERCQCRRTPPPPILQAMT